MDHPCSITYTMNGEVVTPTLNNPYLGVNFSHDMRWSRHIDEITVKANKMLGLLKRNLGHCKQEVKERAYTSMVRPKLEYASAIWDPSQAYNIHKLEQVQKKAARFVLNKPLTSSTRSLVSTTKLVKDLEWDTLQDRRKKSTVTLLFKMCNNIIDIPPTYIPAPALRVNTRCFNNRAFYRIQARVEVYKGSFVPSVKDDERPRGGFMLIISISIYLEASM